MRMDHLAHTLFIMGYAVLVVAHVIEALRM